MNIVYFALFFLVSTNTFAQELKCDYSRGNSDCPADMYCVYVSEQDQAYCRDEYKDEIPSINLPFNKPVTCYKGSDQDHSMSSHSWLNARYAVDLHSAKEDNYKVYASIGGSIIAIDGCSSDDPLCNGSFGNQVKILGENGILVFYAHLEKILVRTGQNIKKGELIGHEGATGNVGGMWGESNDFHHLHMSVHSDWTQHGLDYHLNPWPGLPSIPFKLNVCNPQSSSRCDLIQIDIRNLSCSKFTNNPVKYVLR